MAAVTRAGAVRWLVLLLGLVGLVPASRAEAPTSGEIAGRVVTTDGVGLGGVAVEVLPLAAGAAAGEPGALRATTTDAEGRYRLTNLLPGRRRLRFVLGAEREQTAEAEVVAGRVSELLTTVDWELAFGEVLTVRAASRYGQRIVEAPAAVTALGSEDIERRAGHGQAPRLLANDATAELGQSGLHDFTVNARGFNGSTNRRVLTLLDGRDPSQPVFSGAQEWAALAFGLEELASVEMVRGPGAALYGAGAYNGVLDLRTRRARDTMGGSLRLTLGELATRRLEARLAGGNERLGFVRGNAGYEQSDDYLRSRVGGGEYGGGTLPAEAVAPPQDGVSLWAAALRYERDLEPGLALVAEGGTGRLEGTAVVTGVGRLQRNDVARPWGRFDLSAPHWNLLAAYTGRVSDGEVSLGTGSPIYLDSYRAAVEAQANTSLWADRARVVGGLSWTRLRVDSADPAGRPTIFAAPVASEHEAAFGQLEVALADRWSAVASLRWDESDLHRARWSPRGALVWAVGPQHSLRLTYSEAFQSPTLSEHHVQVAVAPPLDLSALEAALSPVLGGVSLGLDAVPLLAVGNPDLEAEEIATWELGYRGALGRHAFLSLSVYRSELSHFTTNLTPVLGTSLGPLLDPVLWQPPTALSAEARAAVLAALAAALPPSFLLAAADDGSPYIPLLSFGSFGEVDTRGAELTLGMARGPWRFDASASWFDYEVAAEASEHPLAPNRAEWQAALGLGFVAERWSATLDGRWSDAFAYRSGIFVGPVPAYTVVDAGVRYTLDEHWSLALSVANLLDDEHYESFGGDLLRRRALASATLRW
jgi:iron complex outermembrane receptor protein